jgi:hypothetical protein
MRSWGIEDVMLNMEAFCQMKTFLKYDILRRNIVDIQRPYITGRITMGNALNMQIDYLTNL